VTYTENRYTSHDGLSLYYREYGQGPDVVICLHGLTRNCKDFESLAEHLSNRYRVITPDIRGRGVSDRDPEWKHYVPPTYAGDTWTLMDSLGLERAAIVGTSLGGLIAMIMADQHADRLSAVVLNDVGPEVPDTAIARLLQYVGRATPQPSWAAATELTRTNYELAYPGMDQSFWERQARASWREREGGTLLPDYDPEIGTAARHVARSMWLVRLLRRLGVRRLRGINLDPWDNFRKLSMPVHLLRGELSDILPPATVAAMKSVKPDLGITEIPERGHAPTLDEPEARAAIDRFLDESLPR
jgi:pimeloyl-ACP methyl ester carboxylesterase